VFWEAMHSLSTFTARVLGQAVDLSGARRLLDVGGLTAAGTAYLLWFGVASLVRCGGASRL
jgi:hypothetical protein